MSWSRQRTIGARVANRNPSQWLARIERAIAGDEADSPATVDAHHVIADARARVGNGTSPKRPVPEADAPLYDALVEWRGRLSRASGAPAYVVFNNATLAAIASARPRSRRALLALPGVGPVKVERYGDAVLALVGDHTGAQEPATPPG
jgi:superfamily II DNA helicase RecQ